MLQLQIRSWRLYVAPTRRSNQPNAARDLARAPLFLATPQIASANAVVGLVHDQHSRGASLVRTRSWDNGRLSAATCPAHMRVTARCRRKNA
jgi:hypothetical protein